MSQCRGMMIPIYGRLRRPLALPPLQPGPGLPPLCPPAAAAEELIVMLGQKTCTQCTRTRTLGNLWCSSRRSTGVCVYPMLLMFAWPCASCIGRHAALMMPRLSLRRSLPVLSDGKQGWAGVERVCEERVCFAGASAE